MNAAAQSRLAALHRRLTKYECVARLDDGRTFLLGYSVQRGRRAMIAMIQRNGRALLAQLPGLTDDAVFRFSGGHDAWTAHIGDRCAVSWGETERSAIVRGEYPRVPASNS